MDENTRRVQNQHLILLHYSSVLLTKCSELSTPQTHITAAYLYILSMHHQSLQASLVFARLLLLALNLGLGFDHLV